MNGNSSTSYKDTFQLPVPDSFSLINHALKIVHSLGVLQPPKTSPVVNFVHPEDLRKRLNLSLEDKSTADDEELKQILQEVVSYSVKTNHTFFVNQLYGGMDPYGLVGALVTECLNTNQITFEIAPVSFLMESHILSCTLKKFGFSNGEGLFSPGGSISNMYGLTLARHKSWPHSKSKGISSIPHPVIFTSSHAHYSTSKAANWMGIGTDNVIRIPCDRRTGRIIPQKLEEAILEAKRDGKSALAVVATAGTTVLGSIDPLEEIAEICERHRVWLHVDACWGGSLIFSKKHKVMLKGISKADSLAWNAHKMLGAPLQCSLFLTKHKGLLSECNSQNASYLFQQDKFYDVSYDVGDKSVQCGRKVDAFKLWLMWKMRGDEGFGQLVDNAMDLSEYFMEKISVREGFRLVTNAKDCTNVSFWYIPPYLRGQVENESWWEKLGKVAPRIKKEHVSEGSLLLGYQPLESWKLPNFFRFVLTCHPQRNTADVDKIIDLIETTGRSLKAQED